MTPDKLRRQVATAKLLNQAGLCMCATSGILGSIFGAMSLAVAGLSGPTLMVLTLSLVNLFMAQWALQNIRTFNEVRQAIDEVVQENPGLEGQELVVKILARRREQLRNKG